MPSTDALRAFNKRITTDPRLTTIVLAAGDGVGISIVRTKKGPRRRAAFRLNRCRLDYFEQPRPAWRL